MNSSTSISKRQALGFFGGTALATMGFAALYLGLVFFQVGVLESKNSEYNADLYYDKLRFAEKIREPKIAVIGGSNVMFSVGCSTLSSTLGLPCVNAGTTAQLGLDYLLYKAKDFLRPGDTAVLSIEWHHYTDPRVGYQQWKKEDNLPIVFQPYTLSELWGWEPVFNRNAISYFLANDPGYFWQLHAREKALFLLGIENERVITGLQAKIFGTPFHVTEEFDNLETTGNTPQNIGPYERKLLSRLRPMQYPPLQETYGVHSLRNFLKWCRENSILVVGAFPSVTHFPEYDQGTLEPLFTSVQNFYHENEVPTLGKPEEFFYPATWFYDTMYHLTSDKRKIHSQRLADLLLPTLRAKGRLSRRN